MEFGFVASRLENMGAEILAILPEKEQAKKLKEYQAEMAAFGEYLKKMALAAN